MKEKSAHISNRLFFSGLNLLFFPKGSDFPLRTSDLPVFQDIISAIFCLPGNLSGLPGENIDGSANQDSNSMLEF
ncbi:hypothetical protein [Methanolacinia petrolearia]|uniref:hypothetical protein n=1 Tax=Methanolacinia petrolearia TaxID=54120 RepID=UPI0016514ACA|nr:hypothetical protein [Methanolacinia petrolearia]